MNPNFFRMLGVLATLLTISTIVLRFGYQRPGMSVLDAIYFSTETVATVGYGDFNFSLQPTWLRVWSIVLMFAGLTTTALIMAFLAELLVSRRISTTIGRRRARFMSGHVVVIGLGTFGIRVATELRARGHEVVIVEVSEADRHLSAARALDIPIVFGDATLSETLQAAGVSRASAVAVLTSSDMVNVEVGITARGVLGERWSDMPGTRGVPVVMRVFNRSLAESVTERFGFRNVQSTVELAAPWFIGAALGLEVLGTLSVRSQSFMVGGSPFTRGRVSMVLPCRNSRPTPESSPSPGPTARWSTRRVVARAPRPAIAPTCSAPMRSCCPSSISSGAAHRTANSYPKGDTGGGAWEHTGVMTAPSADDVGFGPVDYLIVEFPKGRRPDGSALTLLLDLVHKDIVRVLDLTFVQRAEDGTISSTTIRDLDLDGELDVALFAEAESGLIDSSDIDEAGQILDPGSSAAILVYENHWAAPFATALRKTGAQLVASGRIPAADVEAAFESLDA